MVLFRLEDNDHNNRQQNDGQPQMTMDKDDDHGQQLQTKEPWAVGTDNASHIFFFLLLLYVFLLTNTL